MPAELPAVTPSGQGVGEREDGVVDHALSLAEAREAGARERRVVDRTLGRDHLHGPEHPIVLGHVLGERGLVEEDGPHGVVRAHQQRALGGNV